MSDAICSIFKKILMARSHLALLFAFGLNGCGNFESPAHVSAPIRLALAEQASVNEETLTRCFTKYSPAGIQELKVIQRADDEYIIHLRGKDLGISHRRAGVWEEVAFSVLALPLRNSSTLMLVGLRGKSTFSGSANPPPPGDRWEPFNDQQQALASSRVEIIFVQVRRCLENPGIVA